MVIDTAPPPAERILVVDDDPLVTMLAASYLIDDGYLVDQAPDIPSALQLLARWSYDAVVLDVLLEDEDGLTLCRWIRDQEVHRHIPVLVMTGREDTEVITQAFEAGANDFLRKPIEGPVLVHRVRFAVRAARMTRALDRSRAALADAQQLARIGAFELDVATGRVEVSEELSALLGDQQPPARTVTELASALRPSDRQQLLDQLDALLDGDGGSRLDIVVGADGQAGRAAWFRLVAAVEAPTAARGPLIRGVLQDVSEREHQARRITELRTHDRTSGLLNREGLVDLLAAHLGEGIGPTGEDLTGRLAVCVVTIGRYQELSDRLGPQRVDRLLQTIAARLRGLDTPEGSLLALSRLSAGRFALVVEAPGVEDAVLDLLQRVRLRLAQPFTVGEVELVLEVAAGVAVYPEDGSQAPVLIRAADIAAAAGHTSTIARYRAELSDEAEQELRLEADLRRAILEDRIDLHYQPQVDLEGVVRGVEALARWTHPTQGPISPGRFIPLAEELGMIGALGDAALRAAIRARRELLARGHDVRVSVNVSPLQLGDPRLATRVAELVHAELDDPGGLEVEVTESQLLGGGDVVARNLTAIAELGLRVALDDFGTGYSSLSYLGFLPLHTLKIDRAFVRDLGQPVQATVVRAIVALAHSMQLEIVAEGVEDDAQADTLGGLGCHLLQGYRYAPPLPFDELLVRLAPGGALSSLPAVGVST